MHKTFQRSAAFPVSHSVAVLRWLEQNIACLLEFKYSDTSTGFLEMVDADSISRHAMFGVLQWREQKHSMSLVIYEFSCLEKLRVSW
jgi:hypothetical protein